MFQKILMLTLIVFVLSLTLYQNVSFADKLSNPYEKDQLQIKLRDLDGAQTRLTRYKSALSSLIGKWSVNESKIKSGTEVSLSGAFATTASALASALSKSTPITAVAGGILTLRKAVEVGLAISASSSYVSAMSTTDSAVATAVGNINTAYEAYKTQYEKYLGMMATHLGITKASLDMSVNTTPSNTGPYYHGTSFKHSVNPRRPKTDWDTDDASHDYRCPGKVNCTAYFRSPYRALIAHRTTCGTGDSIKKELIDAGYIPYSLEYDAERKKRLGKRRVAKGCGDYYYTCSSYQVGVHEELTCNKWVYTYDSHFRNRYVRTKCGRKFRKCMYHTFKHDSRKSPTLHSDEADSSTNDDDDSTDTTDTQEGLQTEQTQTSTPSYHTCGVHETSVSGDHAAAGCGVSGHYVCDGTDHSLQASCTVTNSSGQYCTVSSFYACQTHTHQYPTTATCSQCNRVYTPSSYSSNNWHKSRTCTKKKWLQVDGRWVKVRCTNTFYKCTNGNWQCATGEMWCRDADGS